MSKNLLHHVVHAAVHTAGHEHRHGNNKGAAGGLMIALGVFLIPIPFIGIPLILGGLWMACSGKPKH